METSYWYPTYFSYNRIFTVDGSIVPFQSTSTDIHNWVIISLPIRCNFFIQCAKTPHCKHFYNIMDYK